MDRLARADPKRTKPIRNVSHHLRSLDSIRSGGATMAGNDRGRKSVNRVISSAVDLGYKVIDDQIRQGQQAAERIRAGVYSSGDAEEDLKKLIERMTFLVKELGSVTLDMVSALVRDPRTLATESAEPGIAVETRSGRAVQVKCHLVPTSSRFVPHVLALHSPDPDASTADGYPICGGRRQSPRRRG